MDLLKLLQSKNKCLKKFLITSESLASLLEGGDFTQLSSFLSHRDAILKALQLFESKIRECASSHEFSDKSAIQSALAQEQTLLKMILEIDQKISTLLETEKNRIQTEITDSDRSIDLVGKYKSKWVNERGEELDKKL